MADGSELRAGGAYVELFLKDEGFREGLAKASDRLKSWGRSVAIVGVAVTAAGAAITAPLIAMAKNFKKIVDGGIAVSASAMKAGKDVATSFTMLDRVMKSIKAELVGAIAPELQKQLKVVSDLALGVRVWVRNNTALVANLFKIGTVLTVVGAGIVQLGAFLAALGTITGTLGAIWATFAGAVGLVLTPVGLLAAATTGLAYWFLNSTKAGQHFAQNLADWFGELHDIARDTFNGIADAISAGNLGLAAKIGFTGIKTAFFNAIMPLAQLWDKFSSGLMKTFGTAIKWIVNQWSAATKKIANFLLQDAAEGGFLGTAALMGTGVDIKTLQGKEELLRRQAIALKRSELDRLGELESQGPEAILDEGWESIEAFQTHVAGLHDQLDALGAKTPNVLGDMQRDAEAQLDGTADAIKSWIDNPPQIAKGLEEEVAKLERQLQTLRRQAMEERGKAKFEPGDFDPEKNKLRIFGTFNAAAFAAGGGQGSPTFRELQAMRKQNEADARRRERWERRMLSAGLVFRAKP